MSLGFRDVSSGILVAAKGRENFKFVFNSEE